MAWTTPITAVANATFTAAQFNASVRDNLLQTAPALATTAGRFFATTAANAIAERIPSASTVTATETTTATSYSALTTAGPAVTVTTGPTVLVSFGCSVSNDTAGANVFTSYALSGANTAASNDNWSMGNAASATARPMVASRVKMETGITAGSNTFTMQYRVSGGTGTFSGRHIAVIPF